MSTHPRTWATALVAGLAGAGLASLIGLPAAALLGSTLCVALIAALGVRLGVPEILRDLAFATIGVSLGSGIDETIFDQIGAWGLSLGILVLSLFATILGGRLVLTTAFGFDGRTATLASTPGTMSNVIALTLDGRGNTTAVMVLQLIRVLFLVIAVPPLAAVLDTPGQAARAAVGTMSWPALGVLILLALGSGLMAARRGVPAASLLTGIVISAGAHATGLAHGMVPGWVIFSAFAITGTVLGTRLSRVSRRQLGRFALAGLAAVLCAVTVAMICAGLTVWLTGLPVGQVLIAYAPGAVEAMAAIGLAMGYDPAFVAAHHFARIFALVLIVPLLLLWDRDADGSGDM